VLPQPVLGVDDVYARLACAVRNCMKGLLHRSDAAAGVLGVDVGPEDQH
jgi:hypothetical protein